MTIKLSQLKIVQLQSKNKRILENLNFNCFIFQMIYKIYDQCGDAHSELQLGELVPKPDISKGNGLH
jgi:hypothetical protein